MDFTIKRYRKLLETLKQKGYRFQTFSEYLVSPADQLVILRHDVDKRKMNSLRFARLEHEMGIRGTYYFRIVPQSFDKEVISSIAGMGHEIGYHYEDMHLCKGDRERAIRSFELNLQRIREVTPVTTICMHGSPLSPFDNRSLWERYDYRSFGILGEPYFDLDRSLFLYLTDTGRRWDGDRFSVRDRMETSFSYILRNTGDIIRELQNESLPGKIMFTFHPQRWNSHPVPWIHELVLQAFKNLIKKRFFVERN